MSSQEAKAAPSAKGGKLPLIVAVLLALGGAGFVAYRQLAPREHAGAPARKAAVPSEPGVVELEPFVLNLADPAGDRYFRLSLSLLIDHKAAIARMEAGLPQAKLRDRVLSVLSKKRATMLTTVEGKEALRAELRVAVDHLLSEPAFFAGAARAPGGGGEGGGEHEGAAAAPAASEAGEPGVVHVTDVLFTEFLVQ